MNCLTEQTFLDVMLGAKSAERVDGLEQHLDECEHCRRLAASVVRSHVTEGARPAGDSEALLAPGDVVGRYVVLDLVGAGAMSVVYSAYDPQLDRKVSLKLLRPDADATRADGPSRLTAEAQAMARLSHPNVAIVHDVGSFRGQLFIAMELVEGGSLQAWLSEARHPWQLVLKHFVAAGRGLAAAHRANVVHRDFKPANVLVAANNVVRVTDFGLSNVVSSLDGAPRMSGTPGYMAPEVLDGQSADAAADQFSFCVSVWEALARARPFAGDSLAALRQAMNQPRGAPTGTEVPRWVWRVLLRGLHRDPSHRFPSMDELVRALDPELAAARRRRAQWGVATIALGVFTALVVAPLTRSQPKCAAGPSRLVGVWDTDVQTRVHTAFSATAMPYAETQFRATSKALDAAASDWQSTYRSVCEATWVRGEQSPALLDARMLCLERRRASLAALTSLFARADASVTEHSALAAGSLDTSSTCATALPGLKPPTPSDALNAVNTGLGEVRALLDTGQYAAAKPRAASVVHAATALGDASSQAEAERLLARTLQKTGDAAAAEDAFFRAVALAEQAGETRTLAQAWVNLVFVQGFLLAKPAEAHHSATVAQAVVARVGADLELQADLQNALASTWRVEGHLSEAEHAYREALALRQKARGDEDPLVATAWANLAALLELEGDNDGALAAHEHAKALAERLFGPEHPDTALELNNMGLVLENLSRDEEALAMLKRALDIRERTIGPQHPMFAVSLGNVCMQLVHLGRAEEAVSFCERGAAILEKNPGPHHPMFASMTNSLAEALLAHGDLSAAEAAFAKALSVREAAVGAKHVGCAFDLVGLGRVALARKEPEAAIAPLERALTLREQAPVNPVLRSEAQYLLAQALWSARGESPRVEALVDEARATLTAAKAAGARTLRELERWYVARGPPPQRR